MVNTADIRSRLDAVETAEHELAMIKSFLAKGGSYKIGITVDTKNDWEGGQIAAVVNRHITKMPILGTVEGHLRTEIEAAKKALVDHVVIDQQKSVDQATEAAFTDIPKFLRGAK